jgi:hypothetical protein
MTRQLSEQTAAFRAKPAADKPDPDYISIRELQKMSAGAIQALRRPVIIRSGTAEVGELRPIRRVERVPLHVIEASERRMAELDAMLTEDDLKRIAAARTELGLPDEDDE